MEFPLPPVVASLVGARNQLRHHYRTAGLSFTLDGKLVGDLGEAIAAEVFGIKLLPRNGTGIDGHAPNGRSVQVKSTGTGRGAVFRCVERRADYLLFFNLDFEAALVQVVYNGPEKLALEGLPERWIGQLPVSRAQLIRKNAGVLPEQRLAPVPLITSSDRTAT